MESLQLSDVKDWYRLCDRHFQEGNVDNIPTRTTVHQGRGRIILTSIVVVLSFQTISLLTSLMA